jgi:flagellar hook-length control protein FliK
MPSTGQTEPAPSASKPSPPPNSTNPPLPAAYSIGGGMTTGPDARATFQFTPASGHAGNAAPASRPEASHSSRPLSRSELAEHSSLSRVVAGAGVLTHGMLDRGMPNRPSHPVAGEASCLVPTGADGIVYGPTTGVQATTRLAPAALQSGNAAAASGAAASDASQLSTSAEQPALVEVSSRWERTAGADSNGTPALDPSGLAAPSSGTEASYSSTTPLSATGHPELAELSTLLGEFADAEVTLEGSANGSEQSPAPEASPVASASVEIGALTNGLPTTVVGSAHASAGPKPQNQVNILAKPPLHIAEVSDRVTAEGVWQRANAPETASGQAPLSRSANAVVTSPQDAKPQPGTTAATLQQDAGTRTNGIQTSGAAYFSSSESGAQASLLDSSPSGQGKSGQQSGTSSADNSTGATTFAPNAAGNPANPPINLIAAHPPSVPASPASPSAPPAPAPSPQAPATLSAWQNYDGGAGSIVRSARLSDSAGSTEMHVEFRSGALGPLEVHAVLSAGAVGAEIHVRGQEAHTLLAAGLPSLERAMGERNLRVENISVYQDQAGGGMSGGERQGHRSGSYPPRSTKY